MKPRLLIVEPDPEVQARLRWALAQTYDIATATDRNAALAAVRNTAPLVALLDLGPAARPAGNGEGQNTLLELLRVDPHLKIIALGPASDRATGHQAVNLGAYDFLGKPLDFDELKLVLRRCFHVAHLEREFREIRDRTQPDTFEGLVGTSPALQAAFDSIRKVATSDAPVLILGESGTGKEMAARAIHQRSLRHGGPFVVMNCSAVPADLLEAELFGSERSPVPPHPGRFEAANGGMLYLDEVGLLPPNAQLRLLELLQDQTLERIGGHQRIPVDVRVVAGSGPRFEQALESGQFRKDLYYRLAVVRLVLPPLRERGEDKVLLANFFLARFAAHAGKSGLTFSPVALHAIRHHAWPGNIRELQNRIRRAVIMCNAKEVSPDDLELAASEPTIRIDGGPLRAAREQVEREMVRQALRRHVGNVSAAAAELGISRPTLYELMHKLGVAKHSWAEPGN